MNHRMRAIAVAFALVLTCAAPRVTVAQETLDTTAITNEIGREGTMRSGDVYRVAFPRTDIHLRVGGVAVDSGLALGGYAVFKRFSRGTLVMGDVALLPAEVASVEHSFENAGFTVTALHNHLSDEEPHVLFLHFQKIGDTGPLAREVRQAISLSKAPLGPLPAAQSTFADQDEVEHVLGHPGILQGTVLTVGIPRAEEVTFMGLTLPAAMGVQSTVSVAPLGDGRVATTGDLALTAPEVPRVERALQEAGLLTTALHQHLLGESPALYYLHFWGVGDLSSLMSGLRSALDLTNTRRS